MLSRRTSTTASVVLLHPGDPYDEDYVANFLKQNPATSSPSPATPPAYKQAASSGGTHDIDTHAVEPRSGAWWCCSRSL